MSKLIVSLDKLTSGEVQDIIKNISENTVEYKNDVLYKFNDMIALLGFEGIKKLLEDFNIRLMLDPKWNDIPNTLRNYFTQLEKSGLADKVDIVTIHANAWHAALQEALKTRDEFGWKYKIFAITALTSLWENDVQAIYDDDAKHSVLKLTKLALDAWVDGIVCSGQETRMLREVFWMQFEILNPWVRFSGGDLHDQKRVVTPMQAIENGVNHIVMWRPILESQNMPETVNRFFTEIQNVQYIPQDNYSFEKMLYTGTWKEILSYIWAFYFRPEGWKYCRLASWLISNAYINIGTIERNYLVIERSANELASQIREKWIQADIVMWAQMWSVRSSLYLAEKLWIIQSIYTEKTGNDNELMKLKRHEVDLSGKKVIISEDIVTKGSTLKKMKSMIQDAWWVVVAIGCIWNRHGSGVFEWVPLISCYVPEQFELYWDDETPQEQRKDYLQLPTWSKVSAKPKNEWDNMVASMRK